MALVEFSPGTVPDAGSGAEGIGKASLNVLAVPIARAAGIGAFH